MHPPSVVECVANLLKLDTYQFADSLTQRFMVLRGEQITTPLTIEQVSNLIMMVVFYKHICDFRNVHLFLSIIMSPFISPYTSCIVLILINLLRRYILMCIHMVIVVCLLKNHFSPLTYAYSRL